MAETPKLTEAEADFLRAASHLRGDGDFDHIVDFRDNRGLTRWDSSPADGPCLTDLGRAALAAYDAEQRRKVRVEAMRECLAVCLEAQRSGILRAAKVSPSAAIEALISKEEA